ncbi:MAG: cell division protein ZapA [Paludibacteraceae bacterium]|jgi:Cell division protein ZapA.|nr:cell division protein ZapA [Paludibacteraceae bacterium]MBO7455314.1 cell division protein ZapA [Paludibacteraceae bacterium]
MSEQTPSTINITLQLGDHTMRFPVAWNEEKYYRDAAAHLNQRFQYYSSGMKTKSAEQIWVYVALEAAVNLQRENARYDIEPVMHRINTINKTILDALANDASNTQEQL